MSEWENISDVSDHCLPLTLAMFMKRIMTKPDGDRIGQVHYYGDRKALDELARQTPWPTAIVEHPSIVDQ